MTRRIAVSIVLVAIATITFAGDSHHMANAPSSPAFDKMKALVGEWKANVPPVGDVTATYSLHSDGSALVEEMKMPDNVSMVSVYYPTKDGVAMTHYCAGHNQPHMVAKGTGAGDVSFSEVSVDNLPTRDAQHMSAVDFAFKDADHFTATWMQSAAGKNMPVAFVFTRAH